MPTLSVTIEDTSPVLIYSGAGGGDWDVGSSRNDSSAELYSQSSFMDTQFLNANVSFSFYGTGVQIYGAKRSNHGNYQIRIDQTVYPPVSGEANDPGTFQTSLFSAPSLNLGIHTVTMTNLGSNPGSNFLDIDFLTWQTPVGTSDETLLALTYEDSDSSFQYSPLSAWNPSPPNVGMFSGGSGHITTTPGAYVEYTFNGPTVALFGPVGLNYAPYSVQLDGGSPQNYSADKAFYRPQQMLFQAANLANSQHTLRVTSQAGNNNLTLGIDFAQVFTTGSLQGSTSSPSSSSHFHLSGGTIAGIVIGCLSSFLLGALLSFIILRHRSSHAGKLFRPKGKSGKVPGIVVEAFGYRPLDGTETLFSSNAGTHGLSSHSPSPMHTGSLTTPPSTGLVSSAGGTYASTRRDLTGGDVDDPHSQVVVMPPYTSDGKYRPDLPSTSAPQLLPPPRRNQPITPQVQPQRPSAVIRDNRSQTASPSPFGAGQPVLGMPSGDREAEVRRQQQRQLQAVLSPVRRGDGGVQVQQPPPGLVARHGSSAGSLDFALSPTLLAMPPPEYQKDPS